MKKLKSAEDYALHYENTVSSIADVIRMAQIDAIKTTAENCAEAAEVKYSDAMFTSCRECGQDGVDEQSILKVADKMIKEL